MSSSPAPKHIGIIMDGNGRWAQSRLRPRTYGHIKGARVAKKVISECARLGIGTLTLYAFSTENWLRPTSEVSFLMSLLRRYLDREVENLVKENIRFVVIGELHRLPLDVLNVIERTVEATARNNGMTLVFAVSYGSRVEITEAVRQIARQIEEKSLNSADIDESLIHHHLSTAAYPDPDLIIRTSGECRLSNFLLWQAAYAELYFTETLWPDFELEDLHRALTVYAKRERRFGGLKENEKSPN